jgi:trehalose 6-phosphate synthase
MSIEAQRVIVASNRIPSDTPVAGGLAVAVSAALAGRDGVWLGWSGSHSDQPGPIKYRTLNGIRVGGLDLPKAEFLSYYSGFSNRVLWPAFHLRLDLARFEGDWFENYRAVNRRFAEAVKAEANEGDLIWVHDYHLIPLARELRALGVRNRIGFYLHIPFPTPDALFATPHYEDLMADLAAHDLIGLQAQRDVAAFRDAIAQMSKPATGMTTRAADFSRTTLDAFPIGSDPDAFAALATTSGATKMRNRLVGSLNGSALILGVDRLDYSKGLPQRIAAYERLLEDNADLRRRVRMLQVAPPSRDMIQEYRETTDTLDAAVGHLIGRFAEPDWQPLTYVKRPYGQAMLAGIYRLARVGLVTPLRDGMNLVAHEYIAAQNPDDPGVLVLSRFAGAAEIFPDALLVNPFDIADTADAMRRALAMPLDERKARWQSLIAAVREHSIDSWADAYLTALQGHVPGEDAAIMPEISERVGELYSHLRRAYDDREADRAPGARPGR